jgi:hypothetical protein
MLRVDGPDQSTIVRLRIASSGVEPSLARLRLARLLSTAQLQPSGLPDSAVVVVRNFRDPKPGLLRLDQSGGNLPAAWNQAANESLTRIASKAARPAREAVPPGAEAVVFLDRSELLACLARDWCEGSLMSRWWWQSLLKQGAGTQIVKELWRRDPQYVPAALQQLAGKNKAVDFVRALNDTEARQLSRGVAQSFSLPALVRVLDNLETSASSGRVSVEFDLNQPTTFARKSNDLVTIAAAAPWRPWVPECRDAELGPEQEFFLGIALMLQRAPVKARAAEFHASVREWQQDVSLARAGKFVSKVSVARPPAAPDQELRSAANRDEQLPHSPAPQSPGRRAGAEMHEAASSPSPARHGPGGVDTATPARPAVPQSPEVEADQISRQPLPAQPAGAELRPQASFETQALRETEELISPPPVRTATHPATTTKLKRSAGDSLEPEIVVRHSLPAVEPAATPRESPLATGETDYGETAPQLPVTVTAESHAEEWLETQLGGAFYLINLGLALGLYGDFTTPEEPGIQLSIWDFVALLAHELAGEDVVNDPVWPLFRQLAQREEGELLGSGFDPETVSSLEFRVSSFGVGEASTLETATGTPDSENPKLETRNSKLETSPAVAAWLARLMPYVRTRLRQALGLSEADDPGPLVCRHRARVCLTPTHLDVFFFLAELPIELRVAGLDRNPGWVPTAGRFIAFHFD